MAGNEIEESAKAVQEVAKATGKAVDATRELGGFFKRIFGGSLDQVGGMLEDSLRFRREVRLLRLARRYDQIRAELKISAQPKPIEMKIGIPLINAASLEENDEIQDMYANLLVYATDPNAKVEAKRGFVTILQDLGPLEVLLLDRIYDAPGGPMIATASLPNAPSTPEEGQDRLPTDALEFPDGQIQFDCVSSATASPLGDCFSLKMPHLIGTHEKTDRLWRFQPLDRNREVVSMNFCPLDISRRASSVRAPISSFSHS